MRQSRASPHLRSRWIPSIPGWFSLGFLCGVLRLLASSSSGGHAPSSSCLKAWLSSSMATSSRLPLFKESLSRHRYLPSSFLVGLSTGRSGFWSPQSSAFPKPAPEQSSSVDYIYDFSPSGELSPRPNSCVLAPYSRTDTCPPYTAPFCGLQFSSRKCLTPLTY